MTSFKLHLSSNSKKSFNRQRFFFRLAVKERFHKNSLKKDTCSGTSSNYFTLICVHFNPFSANPSKWSNTLKQFVGFCRRIVWVCLTTLWGWRLNGWSRQRRVWEIILLLFFFMKDLKPKMGRFERHARQLKDQKALSNGTKKAVGISLNGSKMAL